MFAALAPLIGAGISAASNWFAGEKSRESAQEQQQLILADKEKDRELQKEFAQHSLGWRIDDAAKYGIHPLAAIGNGASYSPSSITLPGDNMGAHMAAAGQNIGRAVSATMSGSQRDAQFDSQVKQLSLTKMGLENELLASEIARKRDNPNPPMPSSDSWNSSMIGPPKPVNFVEDDPEKRPVLASAGRKWFTDPGSSNAEDYEKRYGDAAQEIAGVMNMYEDMKANYGEPASWPNKAIMWFGRQVRDDFNRERENARRFFGRSLPERLRSLYK